MGKVLSDTSPTLLSQKCVLGLCERQNAGVAKREEVGLQVKIPTLSQSFAQMGPEIATAKGV